MKWLKGLNKRQREKTADLLMDITKALLLAVFIGLLFPEAGKYSSLTSFIVAAILAVVLYRISMKLYKK